MDLIHCRDRDGPGSRPCPGECNRVGYSTHRVCDRTSLSAGHPNVSERYKGRAQGRGNGGGECVRRVNLARRRAADERVCRRDGCANENGVRVRHHATGIRRCDINGFETGRVPGISDDTGPLPRVAAR